MKKLSSVWGALQRALVFSTDVEVQIQNFIEFLLKICRKIGPARRGSSWKSNRHGRKRSNFVEGNRHGTDSYFVGVGLCKGPNTQHVVGIGCFEKGPNTKIERNWREIVVCSRIVFPDSQSSSSSVMVKWKRRVVVDSRTNAQSLPSSDWDRHGRPQSWEGVWQSARPETTGILLDNYIII